MTSRTAAASTRLDWSRNRVNATPKPCQICGRPAFMTDAGGKPCHLACGMEEAARHVERAAERYAGGGR